MTFALKINMGNNSNTVENTTTILTEYTSNVNISTSQSCWTTNSQINVINFACQPSVEAITNISNGFNACIAIAGPGACDRFYVALIDTQLCKFQNITQTITYQLVTNCDLSTTQAASINNEAMNAVAQELDKVDDLGAVVFGALSKSNTANTLNLSTLINQGFDIKTHQEAYQITTLSNVLDITGTGQQANSITQEAKFDATFNGYMQSNTVSDMANSVNNQADQVLSAKTSGLFTAAEAWAEAFGNMGSAFIIGAIVAVSVVVLIILIVPIVTLIPKGGSKQIVETIKQNPALADAALTMATGAPPGVASTFLLPPPQQPTTPPIVQEVD